MAALAQRVLERCDHLATFTEEPGRLTRTFLSPPMRDVHNALTEWMQDAGMYAWTDALGNLLGRFPGEPEPALTLLIGSHLDTVPNAGKYDGALGVLLALAVVEAQEKLPLPFAIEVVGFSEEEGVRFRVPYLGSRAIAGTFDDELLDLRDRNGVTVSEALQEFGTYIPDIEDAAYPPGALIGYIEAHIEQGPVLGKQNLPVGVVSAIAGQSRLRLRFNGHAAHAGTTPMGELRRDALTGAAEFISLVEKTGQEIPGLVATVGMVHVEPNAGNVIPGTVEVSLDVRHAEDTVRENAVTQLVSQASEIATRRSLTAEVLQRNDFAAVPMDERLRGLLAASIEQEGISPVLSMASGAGHDAAIMAACAPSAMLFLRSPNGGLSHHPDEAVLPEDVETALRVLIRFVDMLKETTKT